MQGITVRKATDEDLPAVAALRWRWGTENTDRPPVVDQEEFVRHFLAWAKEHAASHLCTVLVRDTTIIGMTWLAILPRVPSPRAVHRTSADLQCVYVVPEERDSGLGGRLIDETVSMARALGVERVTVHSSPRAIPAYLRHGFEASPRLLQSPAGA
ncbi:GNAT family N-acetyltransferase [Streptomyces sp. NPDC047072]|uniref:GNAT family N-acetyltransferase n=1 Tax=Streptomyces sp. NPDC047072 TaxID=3154809 RepID=UPI00340DC30F